MIRVYLSNICRLYPVPYQEKMLADAVPGWPAVATYRDVLKPGKLKAHGPEALAHRAEMLRPTRRKASGEVIYVASLAVLAWVPEDFMQCLAAAQARDATVVALDTGTRIEPSAGAVELAAAQSEFLAARRRSQTNNGRLAGVTASRAARLADTAARIDLIRADWPLRTYLTRELLERAGRVPKGRRQRVPMAYSTARLYLGDRAAAQRKHDAMVKRMEKQNVKA